MWRPLGSPFEEFQRYFIGGAPSLANIRQSGVDKDGKQVSLSYINFVLSVAFLVLVLCVFQLAMRSTARHLSLSLSLSFSLSLRT